MHVGEREMVERPLKHPCETAVVVKLVDTLS